MVGLSAMLLAQGAGVAIQGLAGVNQMIQAQKQLNQLKREKMPSVLEAKGPMMENISMARRQYERGLDPTTIALAKGQQSSEAARNRRYLEGTSGGQLSAAASRMGAAGSSQTALGLASMDVAARQRGMSALASANLQYSGLLAEDARARRQYRMALEQTLGQVKQQGRANIIGAFQGAAQGITNYAIEQYRADAEFGRNNQNTIPGDNSAMADNSAETEGSAITNPNGRRSRGNKNINFG